MNLETIQKMNQLFDCSLAAADVTGLATAEKQIMHDYEMHNLGGEGTK